MDEMPHGKLLSTTFGKGYTGSEFINRLAKQWHITLGPRKKNDFNKKDDVPPVWLAAGTGHSSTKATTDVTAVWELSGDLASLTCSVSRKVPDYKDFLRDCAKLNYPGAQPTVATRWLKRTMPSLDKAHTQAKKPVGSPLYRSGQAASYLYEYDNGAEGTVDMLRIFGAAS
ncbi:hypothetical protein [Streptomyces sp. NRRL F-5126]|uniref:hypothetical protein n=1 Tax=Streptomyces sp. NRRL F-5126 TaxID=1463857 RepID=UPI00131CE47D|nr:hypothetical protein [Streptomyces sp. NRRL F-5126]